MGPIKEITRGEGKARQNLCSCWKNVRDRVFFLYCTLDGAMGLFVVSGDM